mmetsp:Transcript_55321/g.134363  ORF Transcript_55321/g.134363 Transcript_55321/m.134363 type:complete len:283 (+) Transcript_55321:240-1088(+)|eukprot:CAMPEP_0113464048 /NCGR_PEP_ID=MMETSP0014_2-20120614/12989_1 /TAXON_ID=2857 /ORGANISM="Nitzschia sp." /LENGTH=282 /DNA_ID=CAMNT_0000356095 /DNA_START=185 /DNA_END=1033 /DNA_ORIENTATION=- /assembly_acc=CAM_ASM_000159
MSVWNDPSAKNAFILSVVSVLFTLIAASVGIGYYMTTGSSLTLVFGLENVVDFLSSVVVLWRFFVPGKMTKEREELLKSREVRASTAISFIMILLGLGVVASSSYDLSNGAENDHEMKVVIAISFFSVFVFGSLTIFKFRYAKLLESESLFKDGLCSLIGTILAIALFINTLIIQSNPSLWWLDPFVALICGIVALIMGCYSVIVMWCVKRVPICSCSWWFMSRGDGSGVKPSPDQDDNDEDGTATAAAGRSDLEMKEVSDEKGGVDDAKASSPTNLSSEVV